MLRPCPLYCYRPSCTSSRTFRFTSSQSSVKLSRPLWPWICLGSVTVSIVATVYFYYPASSQKPVPLSSAHFTPLILKAKEKVNATSTIFTFAVPSNQRPNEVSDSMKGPIWSLYVRQPEIQIQRPYTPLDVAPLFASDSQEGELKFLVKRYDDGEVSKWLHRRKEGEEVDFRGPVSTWSYNHQASSIAFIAGGTGITPFFQLLTYLTTAKQKHYPTLHLLYASPIAQDILLKSELDELISKYPGKISAVYFADAANAGDRTDIRIGRIKTRDLVRLLPRVPEIDTIIVCGPEGMIDAIAGPRPRMRGQAQIGGMLQELGFRTEQVKRL